MKKTSFNKYADMPCTSLKKPSDLTFNDSQENNDIDLLKTVLVKNAQKKTKPTLKLTE